MSTTASTMSDASVDYSIVIPVYFNEGSLTTTLSALKAEVIARQPDRTCEVVFVDDGELARRHGSGGLGVDPRDADGWHADTVAGAHAGVSVGAAGIHADLA